MSIRLATLLFPLALLVSAAPVTAQPPSAMEVALAEFRCHVSDTLSAATDTQRECLDAQIGALRADFGRDLSKVSAANRKSMDEACARLAGPEHRTAYLLCVSDQLTALRNRQVGTSANAPSTAPAASAEPVPPALPTPSAEPSRAPLIAGAAVAMGVLAAGALVFVAKSRRRPRKCHVCGVEVHDTDLCTKCRHEAAAAARHVPVESPLHHSPDRPHAPAQVIEHANPHAHISEPPVSLPVAPPVIAASVPVAPVAAVVPVHVEPAAAATPEEEEEVFDPYTVLGVSFDAGREKIRSAYEESKAKYDPELVSYLGDEAQARFRLKAEEVERAYQLLTGARG